MKKKISYIVGTRPNYVKLCQLEKFFKYDKINQHIIIDTGQHYSKNLNKNFFKEFKILKPKFIINKKKQKNSDIILEIYSQLPKILKKINPDKIVVFGDTNSSLAGAICGFLLNIPIVHIEAGVRSFDKKSVEEKNRLIIDHISSMHFVPTINAKKNLLNEGLKSKNIFFYGDIMLDHFKKNKKFIIKNKNEYKNYIFVTLHRSENVDSKVKLKKIFECLGKLNTSILFPIHPRTLTNVNKHKLKIRNNIKLIAPLGYRETLNKIYNSKYVFTDSGGLQKESYFLKKRCIVFRDKTEWKEIIYPGGNMLLKTNLNVNKTIKKINKFNESFKNKKRNIFGNKEIAKKIYKKIIQ